MIDAVIGQDQDNRRKGTRPNQGFEPPLLWSVEFMKEVVHVELNDTAPTCVPFGGPKPTFNSFEVSLATWRCCWRCA